MCQKCLAHRAFQQSVMTLQHVIEGSDWQVISSYISKPTKGNHFCQIKINENPENVNNDQNNIFLTHSQIF